MIPKIIHYCWFGGKPLPSSALKCIESWKEFFPDYEIKEWNESNFDINSIPYIKDAYADKKYAFVSDYARFKILYENGGIYFDTDVEVINSLENLIANGDIMGCEIDGNELKQTFPSIAPGLILVSRKEHPLYKEILEKYNQLNYFEEDGTFNKYTMIPLVTDLLKSKGLKPIYGIQDINGINIYPSEYFNPLDLTTGKLKITNNTRTIHWFMASWLPPQPKWKKKTKQYIRRILKLIRR